MFFVALMKIHLMKKILTLLIFLFILLSCEKKEENFSDEMIEELIVEDNGLPSKYGFLNLYAKTNDNNILPTTNHYLFGLYKIHYHKSFKTFELFLNIKTKFNCQSIGSAASDFERHSCFS